MSEEYKNLLVEEKGEDICRVTINRPYDRNSINTALMQEVELALGDIEKSGSRAIVFSGAGDTYFIGGADGVEMMQCDPEQARAFSFRIQNLFNRMEESPLILLAAIDGLCFGGGCEFALACDLRVAGEDSRVGLPEVKVGLIPGGGGTQRLPKVVGAGKAMEMILRGNLYKAAEALEMGLVNKMVPKEDLFIEAEKLLRSIFKNPQYALTQAKRAVIASRNGPFQEGLMVETREFKKCFTQDYFVRSMCKQLDEGVLKTTTELPEWICKERGG